MRKGDWLLIGGVLLLSVAFAYWIPQRQAASTVIVEVDGREAYRYSIREDGEYPIRGYQPAVGRSETTHILHIRNGQVYVEEARCRDKICERMGKIDNPGQLIVCVPYKVLIRLEGDRVVDTGAHPDAVTR